jgi:hypothetical protein
MPEGRGRVSPADSREPSAKHWARSANARSRRPNAGAPRVTRCADLLGSADAPSDAVSVPLGGGVDCGKGAAGLREVAVAERVF